MSSINRHHTIIVSQRQGRINGVILEKDWYSSTWCEFSDWHKRIERTQGMFHVVGQSPEISLETAETIVDKCCRGEIQVIDLRQFSITDLLEKKKGKKAK